MKQSCQNNTAGQHLAFLFLMETLFKAQKHTHTNHNHKCNSVRACVHTHTHTQQNLPVSLAGVVLKHCFKFIYFCFPGGLAGKESACNVEDLGSILGLGRSPGEEKGYPLQYPGLENSVDCIVHGAAKSRTQLNDFHFTSFTFDYTGLSLLHTRCL